MTVGRTTWWACDASEHDRELPVELGEEHGPAGPYLMRVMKDLAQQQRHEGDVRTGFRSLARKVFCSPEDARAIVAHAAQMGALDDLEIDEDGRRFTCRVSGWKADQTRGREAMKKAAQRAACAEETVPAAGDAVPLDGDMSPVTPPTRPDQTREEKAQHVSQIFDEWVKATDRDASRTKLTPDRRRRIEKALASHGFEDCIAAVRHIGADSWARGANDRGTRFDDIEHALGTTERIERWRDATPRTTPTQPRNGAQSADGARGAELLAGALRGGEG